MPVDYLEVPQIREALASPDVVAHNGFAVLANIARLNNEGNRPQESQELVLRALEVRKQFGHASSLLDALVRQVGLFPYLNPHELGTADQIAWEFNRPANMPEQIVFHEPQTRIYRALLGGHNVVLSAPTSFGKSLVTDAVIASGKFKNVLIVVPTIALMDETRRRLSQRFRGQFKIITHTSQALSDRNVFVLTQERVLERELFQLVELVVIDEFYKLSPRKKAGKEEDARCARLNEVLYRAVKAQKQFYLLGPNILGISDKASKKLKFDNYHEDYRTVVSEVHDVNPGADRLKTLAELCQTLTDPTIIFCSSPGSATEVVQALIPTLSPDANVSSDAANWVAANYHADWHFVKALRKGIGVHHGRIPRALAHYVVSAFNRNVIRYLVCTSTLIEGVNTKAKNVVIYDNKINKSSIDFFTFNNIKGRSGRMGQHYIGHVYLFDTPPSDPLPWVDIPVFSEPDNLDSGLLMQMDEGDLNSTLKQKLQGFLHQEFLDFATLKANAGVSPEGQIEVAKEIRSNLAKYAPILLWSGFPSYKQIYGICNLIWKPFNCSRLGNGSAKNANQLGVNLIDLQNMPSAKQLINKAYQYHEDADAAVQQVLDFMRMWANFHFPQFLRALDRIQRDVFRRVRMRAGNYDVYAARVEHYFADPALVALEEYGIPLEVAKKLNPYLSPYADLDGALEKLRRLNLERTNLSRFEIALARDAQETL
jgi:hypothetical protein